MSPHPWERDALDFIRQRLPEQEPYRAWANFHFIADNATINEVDLLVLTPGGLFLIEIKSWPGTVSGDAGTWVVSDANRERRIDNPLILANSKAKRLKSILERQPALRRLRLPFIEPLVFLSHDDITIQLAGRARYGVCRRDRPERGSPAPRGIVSAITKRDFDGADPSRGPLADWHLAKAIANGLDQAGIRPSQGWRQAGDYELQTLLGEGADDAYQDWIATHRAMPTTRRRVRIYNVAQTADTETRESRERAARREFLLLEKVSHPGILGVEGLSHNDLGPAVVYRYDEKAVRLDHYLAAEGARLSESARLGILRQIAEALKYAHERHIIHRALSPQSILVSNADSEAPTIQIFNWQLGFQDAGTSGSYASRLSPTLHPDELVDNTALVFMAPESVGAIEGLGEHVDVFSLGSLAFFIFAGVPPAASVLERNERLRDGKGLQLSSVLNAAHPKLQELVQFSTHPEVLNRIESVEQFLDFLGDAEQAMLTHDEEAVTNPLEARGGDRLEHGFELLKRLGSGSTAVALLVAKDGVEQVLKLAHRPELNDRIRDEYATLGKLHHQYIVDAGEFFEFGDLTGFTMERAGTTTLSQRLREDGPLHLELLERFGEDLLNIVAYLESTGIPHRDLKPDNIGIRPNKGNRMLHLALFDFSLSTAPAESIGAGTRPYVDPFLALRKPARWDLHAERYAAAMTMYEMATGTHPQWGDGRSAPEVLDCEATLAVELFDPNLRDGMAAFFRRAFRRTAAERFDNAEEMLRAWRQLFTLASLPAASTSTDEGPIDVNAAVAKVSLDANIVELGLSTRAANALDRINVTTVSQMASVSSNRFLHMRGVGTKTRRELTAVVNALRERFPNVTTTTVAATEPVPAAADRSAATLSVDELMHAVATLEPAGKSAARLVHAFLGADPAPQLASDAPYWPSQIEVADALGLTRARIGQVVTALRHKALKSDPIARLRDTIAEIVEANGGVVTVAELVDAVLGARGSAEDEPNRTRIGTVVTRVAIEAERAAETPRFVDRRTPNVVLIGRDPAVTSYVSRLGQVADELAALDPIAAPARVLDDLRSVGTGVMTTMTDTRLIRLAVAASATAALSSRREIYPRGMAAERALRLAHGALSGIGPLTIEEVRSRVAGRYPEAEPLPDRPALDDMLATEELGFVWDPQAAGGTGAYVLKDAVSTSAFTSSTVHARYPTQHAATPHATISPEIADARIFEEKLRRTVDVGGFLALLASPGNLVRAEREIGRRFPVARLSLDAMLIAAMREEAKKAGVDWSVVERADASDRDSRDWANLLRLVDRSLAEIDRQFATIDEPLLVVYPGLLARYDRVAFVDRLRERGNGSKAVWLLMPSDGQAAMPVLDGVAVPVIGPGQYAEVPAAWIANAHRAAFGEESTGIEGGGA